MTHPTRAVRRGRRTLAHRAITGIAAGACSATILIGGALPAAAQTSGDPPVAPSQQATPTEKAAAEVRPAIVYLSETFTGYVADSYGYFNDGAPYEIQVGCTGFGVNPNGYIATAGHCVDTTSADGIRLEFITAAAREIVAAAPELDLDMVIAYGVANWTVEGEAKDSPIKTEISVINGAVGAGVQAQVMPARVVDFRPLEQGDVALLKVETTDLPSVELAGDAEVQIGTPVLAVGYPASASAVTDPGLEPSNKDGQISAKKTVGTVPVYEISAAMGEGMSGGLVADMDGRVLGINSFKPSGETQAFNFVAPSAGLAELMSRNGVENEIGPNDVLYVDGLSLYYGGRYSEAIAKFDMLLQVAPQHAQALQFRTAAAKAKQQFGDVTGPTSDLFFGLSPLAFWTILGAGTALLLAAAVAGVRIHRQRNRPVSTPLATGSTPTGDSWVTANPDRRWDPSWAQPASGPGAVGLGVMGGNPSTPTSPAPHAATQNHPATQNHSAAQNHTVLLTPDQARPCSRCGTEMPSAAAFCATCGLDQRF